MTLRIPTQLILGVLFLLAAWGGAFGIALIVVDSRGADSAYIDCIADAIERNLDRSEEHQGDRPVTPDSPAVGASQAAYDTYAQRFIQYEKEFDAWLERGREINQDYIDQERACR